MFFEFKSFVMIRVMKLFLGRVFDISDGWEVYVMWMFGVLLLMFRILMRIL